MGRNLITDAVFGSGLGAYNMGRYYNSQNANFATLTGNSQASAPISSLGFQIRTGVPFRPQGPLAWGGGLPFRPEAPLGGWGGLPVSPTKQQPPNQWAWGQPRPVQLG